MMKFKKGFILGIAVILIPIMLLLAFSYNRQVRQEALRAHRVYWNDLVTKAAEGVAEEAYLWFVKNPDHPDNLIAAYLKGKPGGAKIITFTNSQLKFIDTLQTTLGSNVISRVTMQLATDTLFFKPVPFPPAGFDAVTKGLIYPDPSDMFGLLKLEIEANYRGFKRKYTVMRDVKSVNVLPGIFGQFTLFVKEKKDGLDYDWNHLKTNSTNSPTPIFDPSGFIKRDSNELSNPIVLIHDPNDAARTCTTSEIQSQDVSPTPGPDWSTIDLTKRGWVFMGRSTTPGPAQDYIFHPLNGDAKGAANPGSLGIPAGIPTDPWLFFGGNYCLSNHSKLWYFLRVNDSNRPAFANLTSGKIDITPYPAPDGLKDSTNKYLLGWIVWQTRYGYLSLSKEVLESFPLLPPGVPTFYSVFRNYFEDPKHMVGNVGEPGKKELPHGSLILPMGDMFPANAGTINDRRSPTVMLGVWLRFIQAGNVVQVDDDIKTALNQTPAGDWLAKYNEAANLVKPKMGWLPYFPLHADRSTNPPSLTLGPEPDLIGWLNFTTWGKVDDSSAAAGADFSKVAYNFIDHFMNSLGDPKNPYEIVMTKFITVPGMFLYDLITGNNMRGPTPSLFIPGPPSSVPLKLENLPTNLDKVLKSVSPTGALVTGSNRGKSFFYEGPNASTQAGRALSGECIALKNLNDRPLAIGNLGALWPFSPAYDIGRKATHIASTPAQFLQYFTKVENGNLFLDLRDGIVSVNGNSIQLQAPPGGKILFLNSGMLIASDGDILVKSPLQRDTTNATGTLVVATAKNDKHITLCPGRFQAFFISSGTLKRESAGAIQIEGGVAVKYLEFKKLATSIFAGYPSGADARQTITWDNKFDIFDPNSYTQRVKLHLGGSLAYWVVEKATD